MAFGITVRFSDAQDRWDKLPCAPRPDWSAAPGTEIFFDDAFADALQGTPPAGEAAADAAGGDSAIAVTKWSSWVPADIIEDEVKSLYQELLRSVRNGSEYRRTDPQIVRRNLALLATWFAVIAEYDAEVRWRTSASAAQHQFVALTAHSPESLANSYDKVKLAVDDLQELLSGGSPWDGSAATHDASWPQAANRSLIMQRWDMAASERLAPWLANATVFERERDAVRHEAGVLAGLAEALKQDGMDDSTETEYREFTQGLQLAASRIMRAAAEQDFAAAAAGYVDVHRTCDQCHEIYR